MFSKKLEVFKSRKRFDVVRALGFFDSHRPWVARQTGGVNRRTPFDHIRHWRGRRLVRPVVEKESGEKAASLCPVVCSSQ